MQLFRALPGGHLFQQIAVLADHIHQRKRRPIGTCLDIIGQRNILRTLLLPPKIHQYLIFYAPGSIGSKSRPLAGIECRDPLDQPNRPNGNQILLVGGLCVVFFRLVMPAVCLSGV